MGFTIGGVPGAVVATIGEVTPSIIVILIVAALLKSFRENRFVNDGFYGLRPASTGLIGAAGITIILEVMTNIQTLSSESGIINQFAVESGASLINWPPVALAAIILVLTNWVKPTKNLHPIIFIAFSAVVGIVFHFGGV